MSQQSTPLRVLVVDDDAMSRDLLTVLLQGEGYAVESADSGEAALALLDENQSPPDLVLADVQMPGTTGSRLAGKLRRACLPTTTLLAMSGSQPPARTIARFDGFLLKPFTMRQVAAALVSSGGGPDPGRIKAVKKTRASPPHAPKPQTASKNTMESHAQGLQSSTTFSTAGAENSPVLNEKIYRQLAGSMPARQLHEMYSLCLQDTRERITLMRGLIATQDSAHFKREAHAIKGSCGMLGATQLHVMAAELERTGCEASGTPAEQVNSLDELSAACERLERMLGSRV